MRKLFFLYAILLSLSLCAQISHGGIPFSFHEKSQLSEPTYVVMPTVNLAALQAEDAVNDLQKDIPWRFGYNHTVQLNPQNSGQWHNVAGGKVWTLGIHCPEAQSINLTFSKYKLPKGAKLFLYSSDKQYVAGAFTEENNQPWESMGFDILPTDSLVVEYYEPHGAAFPGELQIETVTHGYRSIKSFQGFGDSGACNNNVNCPEGAPWYDQKRSVLIIIVGGSAACTGALVNNTAVDGTPYFLTANHCLGGNVANWVFRFNYESPGCPNVNGPMNMSISGATLKANNAGSDMALLQLSATPPAGYNAYYAGWDRSGTFGTSSVAIHHPSGDIKKISFDNHAPGQATWGGAQCWRIFNWEDGTTEPGSSGSPLFNQNQLIIGQLYGGTASCSNNIDDYYGRFDISWNGTAASNRLKDWLDPENLQPLTLAGWDPNQPVLARDLGILNLTNVPSSGTCDTNMTPTLVVRNYGIDTITSFQVSYSLNNGTAVVIPWTGSLPSSQNVTINLPQINFGQGSITFSAWVANPNNQSDLNTGNDSISNSFSSYYASSVDVTLTINTDNYGSETTWEVLTQTGEVVLSGGGYPNVIGGATYTYNMCLDSACYVFKVYDSYGDGLCCQFGQGSYTIVDEYSNVLVTGSGQFTTSQTHALCTDGCGAFNVTTAKTNVSCNGGSDGSITATPINGQAAYTYLWSNGAVTNSITGLPAGNYSVTVTDANGCQSVESVIVTQPAHPIFQINAVVDQLYSSLSGTSYQWFVDGNPIPNSNFISITATQNGVYHVVVTTASGCDYASPNYTFSSFGVEEQLLTYSIYPNPTTGVLHLSMENSLGVEVILQLTDMTGRTVYQELVYVQGAGIIEIPMHHLSNGIYLLEMSCNGNRTVERISKQ